MAVHTDHLGTPRFLSDGDGVPVWRADAEAFGRAVISPDPDGDPATPNPGIAFHLRLPGQYFDAETGLHYNRFRYYDPGAGRYTAPDPLGQLGDEHLERYVRNGPLSGVDPNGLIGWPFATATLWALEGNWGPGFPTREQHLNRNRHNRCPPKEPEQGTCPARPSQQDAFGSGKYRFGDGSECAYDAAGNLLPDRDGNYTFNYQPNPLTPGHVISDVLPELIYWREDYTPNLTTVEP